MTKKYARHRLLPDIVRSWRSWCSRAPAATPRIEFAPIHSRWALKASICSIVPSDHSASTCHCPPSFRTTQKKGFCAVTVVPDGRVTPPEVYATAPDRILSPVASRDGYTVLEATLGLPALRSHRGAMRSVCLSSVAAMDRSDWQGGVYPRLLCSTVSAM
jgi:hypothetical protein